MWWINEWKKLGEFLVFCNKEDHEQQNKLHILVEYTFTESARVGFVIGLRQNIVKNI